MATKQAGQQAPVQQVTLSGAEDTPPNIEVLDIPVYDFANFKAESASEFGVCVGDVFVKSLTQSPKHVIATCISEDEPDSKHRFRIYLDPKGNLPVKGMRIHDLVVARTLIPGPVGADGKKTAVGKDPKWVKTVRGWLCYYDCFQLAASGKTAPNGNGVLRIASDFYASEQAESED